MTPKRLRSTPSDCAMPRNTPDYLVNDAENVYDADDAVTDHSTLNTVYAENLAVTLIWRFGDCD